MLDRVTTPLLLGMGTDGRPSIRESHTRVFQVEDAFEVVYARLREAKHAALPRLV